MSIQLNRKAAIQINKLLAPLLVRFLSPGAGHKARVLCHLQVLKGGQSGECIIEQDADSVGVQQ